MKKNCLNFVLFALAAIFFVSCSDDDSVSAPEVSLSADVVTIAENATSALVVKVTANKPLGTAYAVKVDVSGTAVSDVNYQEIASTVTIPANSTTANIFVTPINVSAIEANTMLNVKLGVGEAYELTEETSVDITITDNANPPSDAPEVSFATSNFATNPYMEEVKTVTVGLSKTFASDLVIPLTITGDLVADTDYELTGLTNNTITIPAGAVSADFTVSMMNTAVVNMDKTLEFAFTAPTVTDYAVKATENTFAINAVDPQVDFSAWFNEENEYNFFFDKWDADGRTYRTDLPAYNPKRYYWDVAAGEWNIFSGDHYFDVNVDDNNQWKEVTNIWHKDLGGTGIDIVEQERYEMVGGDFLGLAKFFDNEATYLKTMIASEKGWFRFVTTDVTATEGTVVVPAQTITLYKIKEGYDWKAKTTVDVEGGTESYYAWYADSEATQGDLSQSTNVTPVSIEVAKSVGTYNSSTKEIVFEITFTCDDADFSIDPKYYIANDGNSYTMKIKYIPTK